MKLDIWTQPFLNAITAFWVKIVGYAPNLIAALIILIIGLFVSKLFAKWISTVLSKLGINGLCDRTGLTDLLNKIGIKSKADELIRKLIYFFLALFVVLTTAETLGLERVTGILDDFILYLPKLFGAVLVILIGSFIGHQVRQSVSTTLTNMGMEYGSAVGRVIQLIIFVTTFSLAFGQLQIETQMLNIVLGIVLATFGVSAAIAMGHGTREVASNIVSGIYAREQIIDGDFIQLEKFKGQVVQIGTVNTIIENKSGERMSIPNQYLLSNNFQYTTKNNHTDVD